MEWQQGFDNVKLEKEKANARFNGSRGISKLVQILECLLVMGLVSWSMGHVPGVMRTTLEYPNEFSANLFNHHVVFVIGNMIIVLLFVLCRHRDCANASSDDDNNNRSDCFCDDYPKHSSVAANAPPAVEATTPEVEERQMVVVASQQRCDEAIEKATRQMRRFERTQSEKLKREIGVRRELRRSETAEMEALSSEEFRRRVDAFIDTHWCKRTNHWCKRTNRQQQLELDSRI